MRNAHSLQISQESYGMSANSKLSILQGKGTNLLRGDFKNPTDCRSFTIRNIHGVPHTKLRICMRDFKIPAQSRWELRSSGSLRSEYRSHLQELKGLPETSLRNFQYSLRNNLQYWRCPKFNNAIRMVSCSNLLCQKNNLERYYAICLLTYSCNRVLARVIQQTYVSKFIFCYLLDSKPLFLRKKEKTVIIV